jgi:opacity protein-like surface antigen
MRILFAASACLVFPLCGLANHYEVPVMGGVTWSSLSNNRSVTISDSPLIVNDYLVNKTERNGFMDGLGFAYSFDQASKAPLAYHLGLMGYFVDFGKVTGLELPWINSGNYDTLNYRFRVKSTALMLHSKMVYTGFHFQPYVFLGLGGARNQAHDYKELATDPNGTAVAAPRPFHNNTLTSFAYEVGVGVQHSLADYPQNKLHYLVSLDYRYMNFGRAELGMLPTQTTDDQLNVPSVNTQALVLSLTTLF